MRPPSTGGGLSAGAGGCSRGEKRDDPREEEGVAAMTRCPREEERAADACGPVRPEKEDAAVSGRRWTPPQDQTPREEERVPNAGGPVWPE